MKKAKTPQIRFKGFCEDWEEKILGKEKTVKDGTHDSPKFLLNGYPLITSKNLIDNKVNLNDISYISEEDFFHINQRSKVDIGDILFGMIGTIGNLAIVKEDGFAIKNVALIKSDSKVPNIFISQLLVSPIFKKYINAEMTGNTQKFLSLSKIRNFKFYCPVEHLEQTKIGDLFQKLDRLIELSKTQLEQTQTFKKAMLQRMFPQNGERAPRIRFKGFCEDWEEKLLTDIYDYIYTNSFSRNELNADSGTVKNIHYGDIHTKYNVCLDAKLTKIPFINDEIDLSKIKNEQYLKEKDLLIADASENYDDIGKTIEIINTNNEKLLGGLHTIVLRNKHDDIAKGFGGYIFNSQYIRAQIIKLATGITVLGISKSNLSKLSLKVPTKQEQTQIGKFFQSLDQKIQSQKIQFNQYQELKKALLQKMFI